MLWEVRSLTIGMLFLNDGVSGEGVKLTDGA
jgi:hypothetical protein